MMDEHNALRESENASISRFQRAISGEINHQNESCPGKPMGNVLVFLVILFFVNRNILLCESQCKIVVELGLFVAVLGEGIV